MSDIVDGCAFEAERIGEAMPGSAPFALGWIAIEQPGPYGREALTDSHIPSDVGAQLKSRVGELSIKATLIRSAGRHADRGRLDDPRHVWVACTQPARVMLGRLTITDPAEVLDFNLEALVAGDISAVAPGIARDDDPLLLVCSHSRRDVCCARAGRPLALALASDPRWHGRVWESSHIGGHRFAPTAVTLPSGWVHGRLSEEGGERILRDASEGLVDLATARGRASLPAQAQVADLAVRQVCGTVAVDGTRVTPGDGPGRWRVATADFRRFEVSVTTHARPPRRESCNEPATAWDQLVVDSLREINT
ncbi:MAG: sucrase ferredoxin [Candidatus Nanopelagicales bacterium]